MSGENIFLLSCPYTSPRPQRTLRPNRRGKVIEQSRKRKYKQTTQNITSNFESINSIKRRKRDGKPSNSGLTEMDKLDRRSKAAKVKQKETLPIKNPVPKLKTKSSNSNSKNLSSSTGNFTKTTDILKKTTSNNSSITSCGRISSNTNTKKSSTSTSVTKTCGNSTKVNVISPKRIFSPETQFIDDAKMEVNNGDFEIPAKKLKSCSLNSPNMNSKNKLNIESLMEISKLKSFWKKKSENESPKNKSTKTTINQNRNSNNSNNKDVSAPDSSESEENKSDDLDEIRPQITPEGYGLRTPYGTHLNLDFLKYCQNIAEGQTSHVPTYTRRLSSSSLRSSLNTSDGKLSSENSVGSDKEVSSPDPKLNQNDVNLFETRRRLDAFRSYRKKVPAGLERQQYIGRISKMSPGSNTQQKDQSFENDSSEAPVLSNLLNVPIPQQNLQVVREQMAAALTRLKFLESEVKQIQVLQVQISVLKQEKQRLSNELKKHKDGTDPLSNGNVATDQNSVSKQPSFNSSPLSSPRISNGLNTAPPPPRRRYKSIAVGTDGKAFDKVSNKETKLSKTTTKIVDYIPSEQSTTTKDVSVGISPELKSKQISTDVIDLCNISTSSKDLISTVTASCGDHITTTDAESQFDKVKMQNTGTDALLTPILIDFGTEALSGPVLIETGSDARSGPILVDSGTEALLATVLVESGNDAPFTPILVECGCDACPGPVLTDSSTDAPVRPIYIESGTDAPPVVISTNSFTQMDIKNFSDKSVETENADFVIKDGEYIANSIGFDAETTSCDASTSPVKIESKNQSSETVNVQLVDSEVLCKCENFEFTCQEHRDVQESGFNTDIISTKETSTGMDIETHDFSSQFRPETQNFSTVTEIIAKIESATLTDPVNIKTENQSTNTSPVDTVEKSILFKPDLTDFSCDVRIYNDVTVGTATETVLLEESETNTDAVDTNHVTTQFSPESSDFGCIANITPKTCTIGVVTEEEKLLLSESFVQTDIVRTMDAVTDTNDIDAKEQTDNVQSEISTYVGQVETLLEEQQSLLANNFKEFEQVLDENPSPEVQTEKIEIKEEQNTSFSNNIGQLDVFTKDGYELSSELKLACQTIANHINHQEEDTTVGLESSMLKLQKEWFSVSSLPQSKPDYINDFVSGVKNISPDVLRLIVNSLDATGNSALHYAISHENFALIYTLSNIAELDPDQYNNAGYTASMLAAITHIETDFEVLALAALFERADVSLHAKQAGQTALMLAVSHGCVPAAKLLIKAGADINSQDEDGSTALMCATEHGHIELVKFLLAQPNCDPTITDNDGSSAINIAMDSGQRDIGVLLYVQLKLDKEQD